MYTQVRESLTAADAGQESGRPSWRVSANVVHLGLTSLFTDISSEMVSTVLPLYLLFYLRTTAVQLGVVDGLYQGVTALMSLTAGVVADRRSHHKEVALAGYGLSAASKLGLLATGSLFLPFAAVVVFDRIGKGIRTAPRDSLISLSSAPERLGLAFGVHRALDTTGALLGPLIAFALLALLPGRFDAIFVVSFCSAAIGVSILAFLVDGRRAPILAARRRPSLSGARALLRRPRFMVLVVGSAALGLATISDAFIYLMLQRRTGFNPGFLPLLYVGTSFVYLALAVPLGRLSDRIGRERMVLGGYLLLVLAYLSLLAPVGGAGPFAACLLALGAYYAATDGVMTALTSAASPAEDRSTGLALRGTFVALSQLVASICFGLLWATAGSEVAVRAFLVLLVVGLSGLVVGLARTSPG